MNRFLRYAKEHQQKILAMYLRNDEILQKTVSVLDYDEHFVTLQAGRSRPFTLPIENLLSCGYARGDSGEGDAT